MPKIIFLDTYYPQVFNKLPIFNNYEDRVKDLAKMRFGTSDYYSTEFKRMGWEAEDVVANDPWIFPQAGMAATYIMSREPDIVYCQDLSFLSDQEIAIMKAKGIRVIAQHSCPWAGDYRVSKFDMVFTSFPHYLERIRKCGVAARFLPIAFGEQVLDDVTPQKRDIDILFIGGINGSGGSGHWSAGTSLLEAIAKEFPERFQWFGYTIGSLYPDSSLGRCYRGEAWGIEMYRLLARAKIVINRHGEVAEGYSNNMRLFEATGMGAVLLTEFSKNLREYFQTGVEVVGYGSIDGIIEELNDMLDNPHYPLAEIAEAGQTRTLRDHTYTKRLAEIEPIVKELIR